MLDGEKLLIAVRDGIEKEADWVLVLDNADDLGLFGVGTMSEGIPHTQKMGRKPSLHHFLPKGPTGAILWTSRDGQIAGALVTPQQAIHVPHMAIDEARALLETIRNKSLNSDELKDADVLLGELDYLPLAISQAASYMRRTSTPINAYLSKLANEKKRWKLLEKSGDDPYRRKDVSNSILETWNISIERIRNENQIASKILYAVSFFDNQNIPFELIKAAATFGDDDGADQGGGNKSSGFTSDSEDDKEEGVINAATRLKEFSFLSLRATEYSNWSYDMHQLVQEAMRYSLKKRRSPEEQSHFPRAALRIVIGLFPRSESGTWGKCEKYLSHALRVCEWEELTGEEVLVSNFLTRISDYLYDRGRWSEKERVDKRAYELRKRALGDEHPDTIYSRAELAVTYYALGRYEEDMEVSVEVLGLRQKILGYKHPDTIESMASLAATYYTQGSYEEDESLSVEVLELRQKILGDEHPYTIESMASLAATYHAEGRYKDAENIKVKVLELRREVLGDKHPDTIASIASLAVTYHAQERFEEDEKISIEVLELRQKILGDKHPDTIESMGSLATTYHAQERYEEAEKIEVKVLELQREILGDKHPDTIESMASLAITNGTQGRYEEAEEIEVEVLELRRKVLGDKHPDTIESMYNLAVTRNSLGRHDLAIVLMEECYQLQYSVLGPNHPSTESSLSALDTWKAENQR